MPLIQVPDEYHAWLKFYAAANDTTMTAVLRMALEAYKDNPAPIVRAKRWFAKMYLWDADSLTKESDVTELETTGDLPNLAAAFVGDAGAADAVRADLPRLRQVLARVQSTSARIAGPDAYVLQIDVYRERPEL